MSNNLTSGFSLVPQNFQEAHDMANLMASSELVPKVYQGKPANVLVAVQMGADLGLKPMASLQNIAVVNGNPCLWGDGLRAVVLGAPDLISIKESFDDSTMTATCVIVREMGRNKEKSTFTGTFSQKDAELAGLWGRNTWKSYPKRMLQWRALGFAARDAFADRLKGIKLAEEVSDYEQPQEREINPKQSKALDPKQVHQSLNKPSENESEKQETDDVEFIPSEKPKDSFSPSDLAHDFGNAIYDAKSVDEITKIGKQIAEHVQNGKLTGDEADWLRPMIKEVKAKL